jgi:hypothetical protein
MERALAHTGGLTAAPQVGLAAREKVIFRSGKGNRVEMESLPMSLEAALSIAFSLRQQYGMCVE